MRQIMYLSSLLLLAFSSSCNNQTESTTSAVNNAHKSCAGFEVRFLDAYWNQYHSQPISVGYGKYYDHLVIPDSNAIAADINFSKQWIDSLNAMDIKGLSDNNKIS